MLPAVSPLTSKQRVSVTTNTVIRVGIGILILSVLCLITWWEIPSSPQENHSKKAKALRVQHLYDEAQVISGEGRKEFEEYLYWIVRESDIDIRIIFVKDTGPKSIEELALDKVHQLRVGGRNREERGVLLLFDLKDKRLRIEIGYGLEAYFPDAFVSYLIHDHVRAFFSSDNYVLGLRLLLRLLHHRIREAVLGNEFDPTVVQAIRHHKFLSGGAGASARITASDKEAGLLRGALNETKQEHFSAQPSPEALYKKYLEWLIAQEFIPRLDIFTAESQDFLAGLPMTKAYFHYILMLEYGKQYRIDARGNVALLYFIDSPFACPHFLRKGENGWQLDMLAAVRNTTNRYGDVFVWDYRGVDDVYTKTFADKLVRIKGYIRIVGGDNRRLPLRADPRGGDKGTGE